VKIALSKFLGLMPRTDPKGLQPGQATVALNVDLQAGALRAMEAPSLHAASPTTDPLTIFPYNDNWLTWPTRVQVVRSPISEDQYRRIYYTGDGVPKMRAINNGTEEVWDLGLPAPATPPTFSVHDRSNTSWRRDWKYRYEEDDGTMLDSGTLTEGPSEIVATEPGKTFTLSTIPARTNASSRAKLVIYFDAYSSTNSLIGRCYSSQSLQEAYSDLTINGKKISMTQETSGSTITLRLQYGTIQGDYSSERVYIYTYVTAYGEEGPPSDPSVVTPVDVSKYTRVFSLADPPSGTNITTKRLYRQVTATSGDPYVFVAEIPVGTTSYTDTKEDVDLDASDILSTEGHIAPPEDLAGLVFHPGGFLAGFSGKTVWMSVVNRFHAWPAGYAISVEYDIVGLGVSGNSICVLTKGFVYLISGDSPGSTSKTTIPIRQACVSAAGIVSVDGSVIYPSPDGLCAVSYADASVRIITSEFYTHAEWQAINPSSMMAATHDGRIHIWTSTGSYIFGLLDGPSALTTTDVDASAAYSDLETDTLYIADGQAINAWRGSSDALELRWRSGVVVSRHPVSFNSCLVAADTYPVRLALIEGGTEVTAVSITDDRARRLPKVRDGKNWQIELQGGDGITDVVVATSMREVHGD